ncbi:glycoside hydrolase family 76 protein [Aspergillus aculeatus ATCC 16872]|uniref:Mannan endo-1,6-alpha-mannosidase n=1 Tax=Aspergillus aculeatus (strain ATCC 16872 / CBS 172.66 / WB 5094) TaxID=690307 RepID=A0A1L9WFE4_ASPA1|nr:glycoside hydrolase family 76 protein [Aspergillus aculeatus ATCC 16872]OJJ94888.1 glycoside hydrolase family 76 protein [Aspergillus aculeatus ATCC 16872]
MARTTFQNFLKAAYAATLVAGTVSAIGLDINNKKSIKDAAATAAFNTMQHYNGNKTGGIPGVIPSLWAEGGILFNLMIQYWYFTGDASNNAAVTQGMYWQIGDNDYMPSNWSSQIGNDDQMAWGLAAMTAAELDYPEDVNQPSWLTLAEGVFNTQVARWDTSNCGGGLRWQIWPFNSAYTLKNAISNGGLFQLSARLARYTHNQTFADWAEKIWDWSASVPLLNNKTWSIADSTDVDNGCTTQGNNQWTANYGPYISGAAYMYNFVSHCNKWKSGLDGLLNVSLGTFFPEKYGGLILSEILCEPTQVCNSFEDTYKGNFVSDLTLASLVAPYISSEVSSRLQASAVGAAKQCTGGNNQTLCGRRWDSDEWDGTDGREEQLSATSIFFANLAGFTEKGVATAAAAANHTTGSAGTNRTSTNGTISVVTAGVLAGLASLFVF